MPFLRHSSDDLLRSVAVATSLAAETVRALMSGRACAGWCLAALSGRVCQSHTSPVCLWKAPLKDHTYGARPMIDSYRWFATPVRDLLFLPNLIFFIVIMLNSVGKENKT